MPFPRGTLLRDAYPDLFATLDFERNAACEIGINTLTQGSAMWVHWLCPVGHSYQRPVRTQVKADAPKCKECQLFINHKFYPLLRDELDIEKNEEEKIFPSELTHASTILVNWKCAQEHRFSMSIKQRVYRRILGPLPCLQCKNIKRQEYIREIQGHSNHISLSRLETGHTTELYVKKLLEETNFFDKVEQLNMKGGDSDICLTYLDGDVRYIQVKTLTAKNGTDSFQVPIPPLKYPDDMLMVMVNKKHDRFGICFYDEIKHLTCVTLTFPSNISTKRKHMMFTNEAAFVKRMLEMIPHSVTSNKLTENKEKEVESMERLEKLCASKGWQFELSENDYTPVDGILNGERFQAKFVALPARRSSKFKFSMTKQISKDGKRHHIPYYVDDFDLLIVELGGDNDNVDKYKGKFCIIPAKILIQLEILASNNCKGAVHFGIYPPDCSVFKWLEPLWF